MSFLLPVLRQSLRHSLRQRGVAFTCIPGNAVRILPAIPFAAAARYSQNHNGTPPRAQSDKPSNAINDPLQDPLAQESSSAAPKSEAEAGKDPLSGDIQAAPGSILSQYTPQESRDLDTTESESAF